MTTSKDHTFYLSPQLQSSYLLREPLNILIKCKTKKLLKNLISTFRLDYSHHSSPDNEYSLVETDKLNFSR